MRRGLVVVLLTVAACSSGEDAAEDQEFAAFDVCRQFVTDQLRSPATAEFRNYFEDDGEVTVTNVGDVYTVRSSVDSENGFGALLRTGFVCAVRADGELWRLESLELDE